MVNPRQRLKLPTFAWHAAAHVSVNTIPSIKVQFLGLDLLSMRVDQFGC
ncbi:hypothetical protein WN944_028547 [Citrus x changshan-huyou]|uniref:Uncharacterized protein n=1 Tax=Citrus x changshan-huyou TaxID=2935761 RepID=A0AAP0LMX4_9ROSI